MDEIKFAEQKIAASEDKILEIMVAADARKESLKKAEAELKADTAENDREKEEARQRTAVDEEELAELTARRKDLRAGVSEDALRHYDRVLKLRGTALAAVYENQMCSALQRHAAAAGVSGGHDQRAVHDLRLLQAHSVLRPATAEAGRRESGQSYAARLTKAAADLLRRTAAQSLPPAKFA